MSIMNAIFFHADNTPSDEVHGSIYSRAMLYWLKANSGEKSRNLISEFLLHPHIRSLRCRAVMGRHDWGQLFEELESLPLSSSGKDIPEVIGIYALSARTTDTQQEFAYVGQTAAMKATGQRARGIRGRSQAHWAEFLSAKAHKNDSGPPCRKKRLFLYKELADSKVEQINLSVLSAFPWPTLEMGYIIAHFPFLLTLAETIDIVYLDTFVWKIHLDLAGNARNPMTWFRPPAMPRLFQGLNRALPINQTVRAFGALLVSLTWTPEAASVFVTIFEKHELAVYDYANRKIN